MKKLLIATAAAICVAGPAMAESVEHACTHGQMTRAVEVTMPGRTGTACEVVYRKPDEGMPEQVLWTANSDTGYCIDKAAGLIDKLGGWGWSCAPVEAAMTTMPPDVPVERAPLGEPAYQEAIPMPAPEAPVAPQTDEMPSDTTQGDEPI